MVHLLDKSKAVYNFSYLKAASDGGASEGISK